jgi:hypothetical protein
MRIRMAMMNAVQKLKKFIDEFVFVDTNATVEEISKSYISRYNYSSYYAIQDGNIIDLGPSLPADSIMEPVDTAGRYALLISRTGANAWTYVISADMLDAGISASDAHAKALDMVEENKNNVNSVLVCVGVTTTFAHRPVFQSLTQFTHVSKADDYVVDLAKVYNSVDELPPAVKKLDTNKQKQWMHVWNSVYNKNNKDEKRAFASAWSVVEKMEPEPADLHIDTIEGNDAMNCPACKKPMSACECKTEVSKFDIEIPLTKSSISKGLVYGIVYEPDKHDTQGDWTSAEEIEKAAHNFLPLALSKGNAGWTDVNHKDAIQDVEVVESYIAQSDFIFPTNEQVKKGSWVLVARVNNPELRKSIEDGEITGYSLEGVGRRI